MDGTVTTKHNAIVAEHLHAAKRQKIQRLYLSGMRPIEIARKMGMKPGSLRQHLYREGLTKRHSEIQDAKQQTAVEVLERVRQHSLKDFDVVLGLLGDSLKIDAMKLRDGWKMAPDAAGASSLMRAKTLLLNRTFQHYGIEQTGNSSNPAASSLSMFVLRVGDAAEVAKPIQPIQLNAAVNRAEGTRAPLP